MLTRTTLLIILLATGASAQTLYPNRIKPPAARPTSAIANGHFHEYALDHVGCGPAIVAIDDDDNVWVALARTGKLARFANGTIDLYNIGPESRPVGLAAGSKANKHAGTIWIAASYDNKLIRFDVATGQMREFKIEGDDSWPFNVAIAPDGIIWFTERASSRIGRFDPESGNIKHYETPTPKGGPAGLAVDPRSGQVWFTESYADRIGVLDPASGRIREYIMSDSSTGLVTGPAGLALDSQGGVWFAKLEGKLGYLAPGADQIRTVDIPMEARRPAGITVAPDGDVWLVALDGNLLSRYRPSMKHFTLYPLQVGASDERPNTPPFAKTSRPFGIAADRQGNVWFSQQYTGQLGVLDVAPPALKVLSPGPVVRAASVPVTISALDRVAGIKQLSVSLDAKPVILQQSRLELKNVAPGRHKLEVRAIDHAGYETAATVTFDYAPDQVALLELLEKLIPINKSGEAAKTALLNAARDLSKGDARSKLEQLRKTLLGNAKTFRPYSARAVTSMIAFQMKRASQVIDVRVLDSPPYFSSAEIIARKGDTVRWKYDPPTDGHSISHNLHQIQIDGLQVRSGLLKAGESFSYRFEQSGEFLVKNPRREGSSLLVKVTQ